MSSSLNDINVLERYHVFSILANDRGHSVNFTINGNNYLMGYYLADGILLFMVYFCKTIPAPIGLKAKHFAQSQKFARMLNEHLGYYKLVLILCVDQQDLGMNRH